MKPPEMPIDETFRLMALQSLDILDTGPETSFDTLVETARSLFGVPTALLSLVDRDRQWFKARVGLEPSETPRSISFCGHAILEDEVFVVLDSHEDERFFDNPVVTGPPFLRFYAGAQVRLPSGYTIGTLCLLSPEPRQDFDVGQRRQLSRLAGLAVDALAVRALRSALDREREVVERHKLLLECSGRPLALVSSEGVIQECTAAFTDLFEGNAEVGVPLDAALKGAGHDDGMVVGEATLADGTRLMIEPDEAGYVVYPA